jgi:uncharacterized protein (UPF0332 family)
MILAGEALYHSKNKTYITMSIDEQELIKQKTYSEALRYRNKSQGTLEKAKKEDDYYNSRRRVRKACKRAYDGVLIAVDAYLLLKGIEKTKDDTIEYYQKQFNVIDKEIAMRLANVYEILYMMGYYDGFGDAIVIDHGFDEAYELINMIVAN